MLDRFWKGVYNKSINKKVREARKKKGEMIKAMRYRHTAKTLKAIIENNGFEAAIVLDGFKRYLFYATKMQAEKREAFTFETMIDYMIAHGEGADEIRYYYYKGR